MHISDLNFHSMAIRHLVSIYGLILGAQGGYFLWVLRRWLKLDAEQKKSAKPIV